MPIPSHSRIPGIFVDFDNSKALSSDVQQNYNVLLLGQSTLEQKNQLIKISTEKDTVEAFGSGSMLHLMSQAYFANDPSAKTYAIAVAEPTGGSPATWTVTASGTFTSMQLLSILVAGKKVEIILKDKDSSPLKLLLDAINRDVTLPVKADANYHRSDDSHVDLSIIDSLTITCKNTGKYAGVDIRIGFQDSKVQGKGISIAIQKTEGLGSVDIEPILKTIKDKQFHVIVNPYLDNTNLPKLTQDLESRFSPQRQIEGVAISAQSRENAASTDAAFTKPTSSHIVILASGKLSPTPDYMWASALAAVVAEGGQQDPALPFNEIPLYGVIPDEEERRYEKLERSDLLDAGFSTYRVDFGGLPRIERIITTYFNSSAPADESYLSLNTLLTLSFLRYSFENYFATHYARSKIADDDAIMQPGVSIMTPKVGKAEAISLYRSWEDRGLVDGFEEFKSSLVVQRNKSDPTRMDFYAVIKLVSQLNTIAITFSFKF